MFFVDLFKKFQSQIKNLSVYFLAALIPMVLSLVSNPFIAKNMSPTDYAITGYYAAFNTLFAPLVNFYLLHYYTKRYFELDGASRLQLKGTLFKTLLSFSFIFAFIALVVIYCYRVFFNAESEIPFAPYAVLSILALPVTGIYSLNLVEYRMARNSRSFFYLSVSNGLIVVALTLLFVVFFKLGAIGKLSATLLGSTIVFLYVLYRNRNLLKVKFNNKILKDALLFCWPLVLASMLTFFSHGYDKVFLERVGEIAELGIYSVGFSIASYLHLFSTSINDTFQPDIYESVVKKNYRKCAKYIGIKMVIMSLCVCGFIIFAPFLVKLLTYGRYVASTKYAIIISLSSITSMLYYSMSQVTIASGHTSITLWNKILGSLLSIVSYSLLIKNFGAIGAAWGTVISYFYFFAGNTILLLWVSKRKSKNNNKTEIANN